MPGHIKLGKPGEPDPDPSPYLVVSREMKREDMNRPYDPKKSVWVPTDDHNFKEGLLESDDGTKAVVMLGHEVNKRWTHYKLEVASYEFVIFTPQRENWKKVIQ